MGIQKCRKTIQDSVADSAVFEGEGVDSMFRVMRKVTELRSMPMIGGKVVNSSKKKPAMSFAGITTLAESDDSKTKIKGGSNLPLAYRMA